MTAEESVRHELRGTDILAKSGAWWLIRNPNGTVVLVHALSSRAGGEVAIKLVSADMGPNGTPSKTIFRRWLKESEGQTRTTYEQDFIERVTNEHSTRGAITLKRGEEFSLASPISFSDGVVESTFLYVQKFRAYRKTDGMMVRLPRNFRSRIDTMILT
jgi:hypothetical protein